MHSVVKNRIPGPPWYSVPHRLLKIRSDIFSAIARELQEFGDIVRLEFGPVNIHFVGHPEYVNQILVKRSQNYSRLTPDYESMKLYMGDSLVTTEGKEWQWQRQMLQPEFHSEKVNAFAQTIVSTTEIFMAKWRQELVSNLTIDIAKEMSDLSLQIAAEALFSVDSSSFSLGFIESFVSVARFADQSLASVFNFPLSFPTKRNRRFKLDLGVLNEVVCKIIRDHRGGKGQSQIVSMMMHATNPQTGKPLTDREIRDQVFTLLVTGHETSANALSWTLYQISRLPHIAEAVRNEVDAVLGHKTPTLADVQKLSYSRRVIQESMRLYPPIWSVTRRALSDDLMNGYFLPKNAYLLISFYAIHRHPEFWNEPDRFDPDRFLPEKVEKRHKYAYLPFGAGPHMCIGREFAMLELQIVLAMLLQKYRFELVLTHPVELNPGVTLRPKNGIKMKLYERS